MAQAPSQAEQDYLKQIYLQQQETGKATTQLLAERLGVKPPSVTAMLKRLAEHPTGPYVEHTPYRGVVLTEQGLTVALEMLRHHRLIELFLAELLDMPWDRVHEEAERLEHVLSEELEERIAAKLGEPTRDPHGDPIPTREGRIDAIEGVPLSAIPESSEAVVLRVPDGDPDLLQYLASLGLVPGSRLTVQRITPYGDVITLETSCGTHTMSESVAQRIHVSPSADMDQAPVE